MFKFRNNLFSYCFTNVTYFCRTCYAFFICSLNILQRKPQSDLQFFHLFLQEGKRKKKKKGCQILELDEGSLEITQSLIVNEEQCAGQQLVFQKASADSFLTAKCEDAPYLCFFYLSYQTAWSMRIILCLYYLML